MEDLTKQQIVLVTLLVSFVTSIATGIVTVSLMEQAPVGVTQTINQVVERTIERVVTEPAPGQKANAGSSIVKETIVVTTEDQAIKAVEKNAQSIVAIKARHEGEIKGTVVGLGIIVSKEGQVATDKGIVMWGARYTAILPDGTEQPLQFIDAKRVRDGKDEIVLFKIAPIDVAYKPVLTPVSFANSESLKLGQSVIALSGSQTPSVSTGIIQSLVDAPQLSTSTPKTLAHIVTSIDPKLSSGSALLNLTGEVIGIKVTPNQYSSSGIYIPSNKMKEYMESAAVTVEPQQ
jgi:S1-C subfamily serine protease